MAMDVSEMLTFLFVHQFKLLDKIAQNQNYYNNFTRQRIVGTKLRVTFLLFEKGEHC